MVRLLQVRSLQPKVRSLHNKICFTQYKSDFAPSLHSLLYGLQQTQLSKLQRVQNTAARLICNVFRFDHISPALFKLHWLPVQFRIRFELLGTAFKTIHGLVPEYINYLNGIKSTSRYSVRQ